MKNKWSAREYHLKRLTVEMLKIVVILNDWKWHVQRSTIVGTSRCKAVIMRDNAGRKSCFAVRDHECDSYCRMPANFALVTKLGVRLSVYLCVRSSIQILNKHATQCPANICKSLYSPLRKKEGTDIMLQLLSFGSV